MLFVQTRGTTQRTKLEHRQDPRHVNTHRQEPRHDRHTLSHFYRSSEARARTELLLVGPQVEGDVGAGQGGVWQSVLKKVT